MTHTDDEEILKRIESQITVHHDWPKKGVLFRNLWPIFKDIQLAEGLINQLYKRVEGLNVDLVLGIESRGLMLGWDIAKKLRVPFCPIRKKNKLPGQVCSVTYDLEYGSDTLEMEKMNDKFSQCLIVDDLLATGGSMTAAKKLVEMNGSKVSACIVVIDLVGLHKPNIMEDTKLISLFEY